MSLGSRAEDAIGAVERFFFAQADPRCYAALRIGYGIAALAVLIDFWPVRHEFLNRDGLLGGGPRFDLWHGPNVFQWLGSDLEVSLAAIAAGLCMVLLSLGIAPRWTAFGCYVWAASYTGTMLAAEGGYDALLRLVGFSLVLSPGVRTGSIWTRGRLVPDEPAPIYGLRLVQLQLFLVYFSTAWLKAGSSSWRDGTILSYFWMSMVSRFPDPIFASLGPLSAVLSWGALLVEFSLPLLLWSRKHRTLAVGLGVLLHGGIALTSHITLFGLTLLPMYFAFFETQDFDEWGARLQRWKSRAAGMGRGAATS